MSGKKARYCITCKFSGLSNKTGELCKNIGCATSDSYLPDWEPIEDIEEPKAVKFDEGKPRMSLVPPHALEEVAKSLTYGASKYSPHNYLKGGFTVSRLLDAAERHINKFNQGVDIDEDSSCLHLANAAASILMILEGLKTGKITDDRWKE